MTEKMVGGIVMAVAMGDLPKSHNGSATHQRIIKTVRRLGRTGQLLYVEAKKDTEHILIAMAMG